jgi:hypothetical protein
MLERYYISLNWYKLADVLELTIFTDDPIFTSHTGTRNYTTAQNIGIGGIIVNNKDEKYIFLEQRIYLLRD